LNYGTFVVKLLAFFFFIFGKGVEEVERRAIYVHMRAGGESLA